MKKIKVLIFSALFLSHACQQAPDMNPDNSAYHASTECWGEDTRTSISDENRIVWTAGDKINIFEGNDVGKPFQVDPSFAGRSYADFLPVDESNTDHGASSFEGVLAMYPYSSAISLSVLKTGGFRLDDIIFPTEQAYDPDSFSDDSFLMTAYASNGSKSLSFKNVCGVLKLELTGDFDVAEIIIEGNSGELISGHGAILIDKTGLPSVEMSDGASKTVSLVCSPSVQLKYDEPTSFYISLPPTEFKEGFMVTVIDGNGNKHGISTSESNNVLRSSILSMPEIEPEDIEIGDDTFASVYFIEGWDETRFGSDGTVVFIKNDDRGIMTETLTYIPDPDSVYLPVYARFDGQGVPMFMSFMDTDIYIDRYDRSTIDFTLMTEDGAWSVMSADCSELATMSLQTKAWADNNGFRNICAIGKVVTGMANIAGGVIMTYGSSVAMVGTAGISTPASVAGIALGVSSITSGCNQMYSGLSTIFGPAEQVQSQYTTSVLMSVAHKTLNDAASKSDFIQESIPKKALENSGKIGTVTFWSEFLFNTVDELWGETYSETKTIVQIHNVVEILTGKSVNITTTSADLYGYINPLATCPLGEKVSTEAAIVLWEAGNESARRHQSIIDGDGGLLSFVFNGLKQDTEYKYKVVFHDKTNGLLREGATETFKTSKKITPGDCIDLGLSVKWASWNVGAAAPEEYGGYYAWGETEEKDDYFTHSYEHKIVDECGIYSYKFIGDEISGTEYDVASVLWGDGWRMPTIDEAKELCDKCQWEEGFIDEVKGYYVTGPNGNTIFIPFAGYKYQTDEMEVGVSCWLWHGTFWELYDQDNCYWGHGVWPIWGMGYPGMSIRPVKD